MCSVTTARPVSISVRRQLRDVSHSPPVIVVISAAFDDGHTQGSSVSNAYKFVWLCLAILLIANPIVALCSCFETPGHQSCVVACCNEAMPGMMQRSVACAGMTNSPAVGSLCASPSCVTEPVQPTTVEQKPHADLQLTTSILEWPQPEFGAARTPGATSFQANCDSERYLLLHVFRI